MKSSGGSTTSRPEARPTLSELAALVGGELEGGDRPITGVADPEHAGDGDLVFLADDRFAGAVAASAAGAVVARPGVAVPGKAVLRVADPRVAMARVLARFAPPRRAGGIAPSAVVEPGAELAEDVHVGAGCVVEAGSVIGPRTVLFPGVIVLSGARIGADCTIYPHVVVREGCVLGDRVIVQPGTVIGGDGYGFVALPDRSHLKIPQLGGVEIGDDVEIGANVTIDRGTLGNTRIGRGTKVDNLVHIAHNDRIGEDVLLVAQVGISGSVEVGDRTILAGQVGVVGHVRIGQDCLVYGKSVVAKDLPDGSRVSGIPARPHREELRRQASLDQVAGLRDEVRALREAIEGRE